MKNENIIIIILVALLFLFVLGWPTGGYGMMSWMFGSSWGFMWVFMIIIWVLLIVLMVLGIMWLAKQVQK